MIIPDSLTQRFISPSARLFAHRDDMLEMMPKEAIVAEIGAGFGYFSNIMLQKTRPRRLHLFDIVDRKEVRLLEQMYPGVVEFHVGRSDERISIDLPNGCLSWAFIDADHTYQGVQKDVHAILPKMGMGQHILVFHDYILYDHTLNMEYGVIQTVNELCVLYNYKVVGFALCPQMFCSIAIQKE